MSRQALMTNYSRPAKLSFDVPGCAREDAAP
jgi:hypothetical protein